MTILFGGNDLRGQVDSSNTSIGQVPALHKWAVRTGQITGHDVVLDFGCGKTSDGKDYLYSQLPDILVHEYDKYWDDNEEVLHLLATNAYDVILCANVLNVISSDGDMEQALSQIAQGTGLVLISVYEGDRTGVGRTTTRGYQRNLTRSAYADIIGAHFKEVKRQGDYYVCNN